MEGSAGRRSISSRLHEQGWDPGAPTAAGITADDAPSEGADTAAPLLWAAKVDGSAELPRPMTADEVAGLGDHFSTHVLRPGTVPLTLRELDDAIAAVPAPAALPMREMFVVAEGAAHVAAVPAADVNTRLVYVWRRSSNAPADLMLSTRPAPDDPDTTLQVISWSETRGAYQFFERVAGQRTWLWAGSSRDALVAPTRGKGPFDSHVNGSLVMKELAKPWVHWLSSVGSIDRTAVLPPPLDRDPLFADPVKADDLERIVRQGIARWTTRRLADDLAGGTLDVVDQYARQLVATTSVNLVSAEVTLATLPLTERITLPSSCFLDVDGISSALRRLGRTDLIPLPLPPLSVPRAVYQEARSRLGLQVVDGDGTVLADDTGFVFTVPQRAAEDIQVATTLVGRSVITARLALALALVDLPNPVFSARRARLAALFPTSAPVPPPLDEQVLAAARAAAPGDPVAAELLTRWDEAADPDAVARRLVAYVDAIRSRVQTTDGMLDVLRLAESRNRQFRARPLAEFAHTTARTNAAIPTLAMAEDGTVVTVADPPPEEDP